MQQENHMLQKKLLVLNTEKTEISIEQSKIELEKSKLDLETARQLAAIEIEK